MEPDCVPHVVCASNCATTCKVGYHIGRRTVVIFGSLFLFRDGRIYWNQLLCEEDILYCEN